jgi:urate oxidase
MIGRMTLSLGPNRYGESGVRLVRLLRRGDRDELRDLTVDITLEGDFVATHLTGDNRKIVPADTMKNTVYALASRHGSGDIEDFALALTHHFILEHDQITQVSVLVRERLWSRIAISGRPHDHAFSRSGDEKRVTRVRRTRAEVSIESGIEDLLVLKTRGAGFEGYVRDRYTTLPESGDRMLATVLNARWRYGWAEVPFTLHWQQVRQVVLGTFAEHDSRSMQHTLYAMAQAALEQCPPITEIRFRMPHRPHLLVDLSPFGLSNDNEVFIASDRPFAMIEATVRREEIAEGT